jgi:hypothetical protein
MAQCCFCSEWTDESAPGSLTFSVVAAARLSEVDPPTARYWCHPRCLAARLAEAVAFDVEGFDE